jgi:hypothetical protein
VVMWPIILGCDAGIRSGALEYEIMCGLAGGVVVATVVVGGGVRRS